MKRIDIARCLRAMKDLEVEGLPRERVIEDAIARIQACGTTAMAAEYIGVKNYAGFGDQRLDCEYGMGPRHGHIVFRIGRTRDARSKSVVLGDDHIYFLECCRDFGAVEVKGDRPCFNGPKRTVGLAEFLSRYSMLTDEIAEMQDVLNKKTVETYMDVAS